MATRTVKEGNAFYEIDDECVEWQQRLRAKKREQEEQASRFQSGEYVRRKAHEGVPD